MEDEWISAADAFALVHKTSPYSAAESICSRAHDGVISAKAHTLIVGERRTNDVEVPAGFWWARGHAALDQNWPLGDFETWIDRTVYCRAYGVTFLKRDITAMLPATSNAGKQRERAEKSSYKSSWRCVEELQQQLNCTRKEATDHIVRFCSAGLVEARCASFWQEVTDLLGPKDKALENVAIPSWFWEHCVGEPDAILDWRSGTFAGRGTIAYKTHKVRIKGAEFDISGILDLETLLRTQDAPNDQLPDTTPRARPQTPSSISSRGGRPKSENWANWIAELVSFMHESGMPDGAGAEGQDAVIGIIDERLAARGLESPGRTTVQPAVRAVLLRLRSAGK